MSKVTILFALTAVHPSIEKSQNTTPASKKHGWNFWAKNPIRSAIGWSDGLVQL
jgi:hypothetical protein